MSVNEQEAGDRVIVPRSLEEILKSKAKRTIDGREYYTLETISEVLSEYARTLKLELNEAKIQAAQASEIDGHFLDLIIMCSQKLGCEPNTYAIECALNKLCIENGPTPKSKGYEDDGRWVSE